MMQIRVLSKEFVHDNLAEMMTLDGDAVKTRLLEAWDEENFKRELKDKWRLSQCALEHGRILGYRIVSGEGKLSGCAHSHRTSVMRLLRGRGIGQALLKSSVRAALDNGYIGMTGIREPHNEGSRRFLINTGWRYVKRVRRGNELWHLDFST